MAIETFVLLVSDFKIFVASLETITGSCLFIMYQIEISNLPYVRSFAVDLFLGKSNLISDSN